MNDWQRSRIGPSWKEYNRGRNPFIRGWRACLPLAASMAGFGLAVLSVEGATLGHGAALAGLLVGVSAVIAGLWLYFRAYRQGARMPAWAVAPTVLLPPVLVMVAAALIDQLR